jgi:hypothetical protein
MDDIFATIVESEPSQNKAISDYSFSLEDILMSDFTSRKSTPMRERKGMYS